MPQMGLLEELPTANTGLRLSPESANFFLRPFLKAGVFKFGAGAAEVATCNTIAHASNGIDVTPRIADAVRALLSPAQKSRTGR